MVEIQKRESGHAWVVDGYCYCYGSDNVERINEFCIVTGGGLDYVMDILVGMCFLMVIMISEVKLILQ